MKDWCAGNRSGLAGLVAMLLVSGCGDDAVDGSPPPGATQPNILLIVVDTLRKDHLSTYGYERKTSPQLDSLAARGLRYDRAVSQAPWTTPSIGALLTSRYPTSLGIRGERNALSDEVVLLPEALEAAGYLTAAVISHSFLGSDWNFDQGFGVFDEEHVLGHAAVTSEGVTDTAIRLLGMLSKEEEPFFLFVHYFDPHVAYVEHEAFPFGGAGGYEGRIKSGLLYRELRHMKGGFADAEMSELLRLYDSEIAFTDNHLGRLLAALETTGAFDDTLVVFTADHGEEFLEHGQFGHAKTLYQELLDVPLIIKPQASAGIEPAVITTPVALIDVYPTILALAGVDAPAELEGSVIAPAPPKGRALFAETARAGGTVAVFEDPWKLIAGAKGARQLFDLDADPAERSNLARTQIDHLERLEALIDRWRERTSRSILAGEEVELTPDQRTRVDNLGYGGGDR